MCLLNQLCSFYQSQFDSLRPKKNEHHFAGDIFKCTFLNEDVWIQIKAIVWTEVDKASSRDMASLGDNVLKGFESDERFGARMTVYA